MSLQLTPNFQTPPSSPRKLPSNENLEGNAISPTADIGKLLLNDLKINQNQSTTKKRNFEAFDNEEYQALTEIGLSKLKPGQTGKCLEPNYILELITPKHIKSKVAKKLFEKWTIQGKPIPFLDWVSGQPVLPEDHVQYLNETERSQYQVTFGKDENGKTKMLRRGQLLTSIGERSNHGSKNTAIYVLSCDSLLYVGSHNKRGTFHHSSFLSGEAVLAAGEIKTDEEGTITEITLRSNHYKPKEEHLIEFLRFLNSHKIDLTKAVYAIYDPEEPEDLLETYKISPDEIDAEIRLCEGRIKCARDEYRIEDEANARRVLAKYEFIKRAFEADKKQHHY